MATYSDGSVIYIMDSDESEQDEQVIHSLIDAYPDCFDLSTVKQKIDPIDVNYPHKCYNSSCDVVLNFRELVDRNVQIYPKWSILEMDYFYDYKKYKHLKKLWKNRYVQFLCCNCYNDKVRKKE